MPRILLLALAMLLAPAVVRAQEETCASCHEQTTKIKGSVHEALTCGGCHPDHESYPHPAKSSKPKCADCHEDVVKQHAASVHGQELRKGNGAAPECQTCHSDVHEVKTAKSAEWRKSIPDTCGMCHDKVAAQFKDSVHGTALAAGTTEAPSCTDCHGEHGIARTSSTQSPVHPSHIRETCGSCHEDVRLARKFGMPGDRLVSFDQSFHGLALKAGNQTVANCASCHGVHNIYPSTDKRATTNAANLPKTCGQANCHPGTTSRFNIGTVHVVEGRNEPPPVQFFRGMYLLLIPLTIGFMLLHNAGDFVRKVRHARFQPAGMAAAGGHQLAGPPKLELRMFPFERLQHALLVVSFFTLVWTGFALKYPDAWWAYPLSGSFWWRGTIHRIAAVVMVVVSLMHVVSIALNKRLRDHWKRLIPRWTDVPEAIHSMAWNLGLTKKKPRLPAYNFIEKAEYWAVVWGTLIMTLTGIMLWFNTYFLRLVPKVWMDVATTIHLYEALLAFLAIVVWHLYFVIFDPEVYPLNTAFITGRSVRQGHGDEDEETPGTGKGRGHGGAEERRSKT